MTIPKLPFRELPAGTRLDEALAFDGKRRGCDMSTNRGALSAVDVLRQTKMSHRQRAGAIALVWNEAHVCIGSFADEHSTL